MWALCDEGKVAIQPFEPSGQLWLYGNARRQMTGNRLRCSIMQAAGKPKRYAIMPILRPPPAPCDL